MYEGSEILTVVVNCAPQVFNAMRSRHRVFGAGLKSPGGKVVQWELYGRINILYTDFRVTMAAAYTDGAR